MRRTPPSLSCRSHPSGELTVALAGDWRFDDPLPDAAPVLEALNGSPPPTSITFETSGLGGWDATLLAMLTAIRRQAEQAGIRVDQSHLPPAAGRLLTMAFAVRGPARRDAAHPGVLERIGQWSLRTARGARVMLTFVGEVMLSLGRYVRRRATYLPEHVVQYVQEAGVGSLPIVSLITFLIGMIFAFVGVMQLEPFGVGIYTADLVGIAMVREMAPIMTAILMAGRTGASYAAQIGTMKVNEEVDALTTLGIDPVDFLVTPRVLALTLMMPLLSLYGSLLGILGGMSVATLMLDISITQYVQQSIGAIDLHHLWGGLFKALVYGTLVALAGCQQGLACGSSAMAVGQATTRAVVAGIVAIVVSASILTIIYINLGI